MREYKPISYYIKNNYTTLSNKSLKRNAIVAYENNDVAVRKVMNEKNRPQYEIDINCINKFSARKRIPKGNEQLKKVKSEFVDKSIKKFKSVVTINFSDNTSKKLYQLVLHKIFIKTKCDIFYAIERDKNNYNHIHFASTLDKFQLKDQIDTIVNGELMLSKRICIKVGWDKTFAPIEIEDLISEEDFKQYIEKQVVVRYLNLVSNSWILAS